MADVAVASVPSPIPPMLRDELFHPASVHFPIAFLALAGLIAVFWFFTKRGMATLFLILLLGVVGGWVAILTGGWAEDVVNRVICDPTVTERHSFWAKWDVWNASAALPFVFYALMKRKKGVPSVVRIFIALILIFVTGAVLYAGHLGASLVYQQAAAVYKPLPQCTEFE